MNGVKVPGAATRAAQRSLRIPLEFVDDATWGLFRKTAAACARFANGQMSELYAGKMAVLADKAVREGRTNYRRWNTDLPATLRDSVTREVQGAWRRNGRAIIAGTQRLSLWAADRALCIRADRGGLTISRDEAGNIIFILKILPGDDYEATRRVLKAYMPAVRKARWLREPMNAMADGKIVPTKGTLIFQRPGRKLALRVSYEKAPQPVGEPTVLVADLRLDDEEALRLSCGGRSLSLGCYVYRVRSLKEHYSGIVKRLSRDLGVRGRRRTYRLALLKAGSFEKAAEGPLHALSRMITDWCRNEKAGVLIWSMVEDGTFPWDRLAAMIRYKCQDAGISFIERSSEPEVPEEEEDKKKAPRKKVERTDATA